MKIFGFWHICMINHYSEIISGQLKLMTDSGLYDKSENIFVGCLGQDLSEVEKLFKPYRKIKILSHSAELTQYEFLTLKILRDKSKTEKSFYGFYFHTKGASYPNPPHREGGDYWRDYMNHYLLTKWKDNVEKLDDGCDTCGVKFIKAGFPPHYSGNFFWFKSDYANTLAPISKLNNKDRFVAEMWLCSNYPKVACLCDMLVDYKTRGKFNPDGTVPIPREVVLEKPVEKPQEKPQEKPKAEVKPPNVFTSLLINYDLTTNESKDIVKRLDRFEAVAREVIDDFYKFKSGNVEQLFDNLSRLLKNSMAYYLRK